MKAWIIKDIAPLNQEPQWGSELADEVLFGMPIEVLAHAREDWYHIRTDYGYEGYLHKRDFLPEKLCAQGWCAANRMIVIKAYADILTKPKVQGILMQGVPRGGQVAVLDEKAEDASWKRVLLPNGEKGWIHEENLIAFPDESLRKDEKFFREQLIEMAKRYLGAQYRWGGKTHRGLDCSGLCFMAYRLLGITIYRDAQIKDGFEIHEIPKEQVKKGDLLFFPGHVAMYIEDGRYIHSSAGNNGVAYNSFNPQHEDFSRSLLDCYQKAGSIFGGSR